MRILIHSFGSYGDMYPFVGLGKELKDRGHEVLFYANGRFEPIIKAMGLGFVEIGHAEEYERFIENPEIWSEHRGLEHLLRGLLNFLPQIYHDTVPYIKPGQTLIIGSTLAMSARLIQDSHQIPGVTVHLAPSIFRTLHRVPSMPGIFLPEWLPVSLKQAFFWFADKYLMDPLVADGISALRAKLNLPPVSRIFREWIHSPDLVIGMFPDWFGEPQPDWPEQVHCTGFPLFDDTENGLDETLLSFLASGDPPIVFTAGTAMKYGDDFFETSVDACRLLGQRGILATKYPEQLPDRLPDGVIHINYAPFSSLLKHTAALVHHGGIGTSSQALRAAVPQLIRPCAYDQFDNARRLVDLGVAEMVTRKRYGVRSTLEKLEYLLEEPTVKQRCTAVSERFSEVDAIRESCDHIENLF